MKEYSNNEITVKWQPKLYKHSGVCVKTLPKVYNLKKKPWINLDMADTDKIKSQIKNCPSGALSFKDLIIS
jgi:uncharacterized Fe-S cluster protein YjdI